ncbi:MAG: hypothetical protein KAT34_06065 [Candidatus Aminicenantes bacterium]|nr:hypothetical protein [Candidatus Aminicenantes bacterium]
MRFILLGVLIVLPVFVSPVEVNQRDQLKKKIGFNTFIFNLRVFNVDFGSRQYRQVFESMSRSFAFDSAEKTGKDDLASVTAKDKTPYNVIRDKIMVPPQGFKKKSEVTISFLYEIDDDLVRLPSIFKVGWDTCFLLNNAVERQNRKYNGIYRINDEKWYELITGTKFDFAADLNNNRVVGYCLAEPLKLYGFRQNFKNEFFVKLPDFSCRQELHKLGYNTFLFHNYRINPQDYAVEIYNIKGKRVTECFDYIPYHFKQNHTLPLARQTVLTTDKKGHFFIAFQYPLNPYRLWKYDEKGKKLKVFGNYFTSPDIYEAPFEWIGYDFRQIERFGIKRMYTLNKLLCDLEGMLLVFFSKNRLEPWSRGGKRKYPPNYFIDFYSTEGDFIARKAFKYGFPEFVYNGIIYSRVKVDRGVWKIVASRLSLK